MIVHIDYNSREYNLRYLFIKYCPEIFYPFVLNYFYEKKFGKKLNLKNPNLLSEKLLWMILYDKNPMKTILSDRLKAKDYVLKLIPSLKVAKVYQTAKCFDAIDFNSAPETFVIKTNHAWKSHILVEDKNKMTSEDYNSYRKFYKKVLGINYAYWGTPELQYKNIERKIYLEEYLKSNEEYSVIREYEVYCFNNKPEFINYSVSYSGFPESERFLGSEKQNFLETQCFDINWNKAKFKTRFDNNLSAPTSINKDIILNYAEILSSGFDFVRIDFFEVDNQLYFGEFTFSPFSGFIEFDPIEYDLYFGKKLKIRKI